MTWWQAFKRSLVLLFACWLLHILGRLLDRLEPNFGWAWHIVMLADGLTVETNETRRRYEAERERRRAS